MEANWEPGRPDDENVAWARETVAAVEPFSSGGGYLNFPGFFEEGEAQLEASYGERNYARLVALKDTLHPENLFATQGGIPATA